MSEDTSGTDTIVELSEEQLTPIIEAAVKAAVDEAIEPLVTTKVTSYLEDMQPVAAQPKEKEVKGRDFSRIVQALAANKGSPTAAVPWAEKRWGDAADQVVKALQASEDETGGFLVPEDMAADVIELLRAQSVVMQSQPMTVPMPSGNLTMPRLASGTAANYIGESEDIGATGVRFDNVRLSARKLAALVPISNDLLRFASPSVDAIVRDDLVQSMSLRMDIAFLRGAGTEQSPRGLLSRAPAANVIAMSASPNINRVLHDLQRAVIAIANGNVPMLRMGWIMAPRTRVYLQELRDNGQRVFPEIDNNQLRGYPVRESTQVPINLGAGGNESEIYFCDFSQIVVGEAMGMTITMAENVSYIDANGAMQSAFSRDETVIRAIVQHDINTRHPESIVVLNGVTWGTQALEVPARQTP